MTDEQRKKDKARSYAGVYKRYGKLVPKPCEVCGTRKVEMHHDDYSKPLDVRWLCRPHHLAHHRAVKRWVLDDVPSEMMYQFTIPLTAGSVDRAIYH